MRIQSLSRHLKSLCKELGPEYRIRILDLEYVIYRDFGNGYDIEVSEVNTTKANALATIYLWKDKNRIVKIVKKIPQQDIGKVTEWLREKAMSFTHDDFGRDGFLKEKRTVLAKDIEYNRNS